MASITKEQSANREITSTHALWAGIIFSFLFTLLIWAVRPWLPQVNFLPDAGASWYYWKLPEQTLGGQVSAWGFYLVHQFAIWYLIYYAQKNKLRYTNKLHSVNIWALGINALFIVLHLVQTAVWYDALAQDTSPQSSQASVILLLVGVLLIENQRRGLFFGKKVGLSRKEVAEEETPLWRKARIGVNNWGRNVMKDGGYVMRKYHGYIFAWGIIYTFWFHPMESSFGHLVGFLYTFLLMLQGSLFFTRIHVNKWWMVVSEVSVLFHGTTVALQLGQEAWAMFMFGFAGIFVITQMYGLGLSKWVRWGFIASYIVSVIIVYSDRWADINEIIRIPIIEYALVFILALILWAGLRLFSWASSYLTNNNQTVAVPTD